MPEIDDGTNTLTGMKIECAVYPNHDGRWYPQITVTLRHQHGATSRSYDGPFFPSRALAEIWADENRPVLNETLRKVLNVTEENVESSRHWSPATGLVERRKGGA